MRIVLVFIFFISCYFISAQSIYIKQWPQFRGPFASGIIDSTDLVENWSIKKEENIKWKTKIPGLAHSSPIIWDSTIFITSAIKSKGKASLNLNAGGGIEDIENETSHEYRIFAVNKNNGEILWNKLAHVGIPKSNRHSMSSHANPTPATNGKYVLAFFGSEGLFCYDFKGELIWKKEYSKMQTGYYKIPSEEWGTASSPVIHNNSVIIQCDFLGDSFIASYNIETGEENWLIPRDEVPTWSTPTIYSSDTNTQIIVNGYKHIGGYDFNTGKEIWKMHGGGDIPVPTPIVSNGLIFIHSAHGRLSPIYAIKTEAKGDISLAKDSTSNEYITWSIKRGAAYMPTQIVYGNYLYNMTGYGTLSCFEAKTGKLIYQENVPDANEIVASCIASDGKLYYCTDQGDIFIIKAGPEFEVIAKNSLNDAILATPAISENSLYFRTQHYLIAVGK